VLRAGSIPSSPHNSTILKTKVHLGLNLGLGSASFPTGVTSVPSISKASRQHVLGQVMDLNCLTWIVSLGMAEQHWLRTTSIVVTPLMSSLPIVMVEASTGGEKSCIFHLWSTWDMLGEHVEVVAHVVGGVYCSNGVPFGDMEERVASPKVLA